VIEIQINLKCPRCQNHNIDRMLTILIQLSDCFSRHCVLINLLTNLITYNDSNLSVGSLKYQLNCWVDNWNSVFEWWRL